MSRQGHMRAWQEERAAQAALKAELKEKATAEQKALRDWTAKPWAEQVADAGYVLRWAPWIADSVMKGTFSIIEALASTKEFEQICIRCAAKSGVSVDVVWALMQLPEKERTVLLAPPGPDEDVRNVQEWWAARVRKARLANRVASDERECQG